VDREPDFVATIVGMERLRLSKNGNPRFRVVFDTGAVLETESDASINYGIGNPEYRDVPLRVWTTKRGKITHLDPAS
jgi:hypothetical protein